MSEQFGYWNEPNNRERLIPFQLLDIRHFKGKNVGWFWWLRSPVLMLLKPIEFTDRTGQTWTVPKDFHFNANSVPVWAWLVCPPEHPDALAASCLHDWLCTEPYPCSSTTAARIYWEAMRANGYYAFGSWRNWFAVRWFGPRFKPTKVE